MILCAKIDFIDSLHQIYKMGFIASQSVHGKEIYRKNGRIVRVVNNPKAH